MRYKIYYQVPSCNLHRSCMDANYQDDLSGLAQALSRLSSEDDCVYVHLSDQKCRIEFYLDSKGLINFEIHDSESAGIYSKEFSYDRLNEMVSILPVALSSPEELGFSFEPW